jgi:hypothetical protein
MTLNAGEPRAKPQDSRWIVMADAKAYHSQGRNVTHRWMFTISKNPAANHLATDEVVSVCRPMAPKPLGRL